MDANQLQEAIDEYLATMEAWGKAFIAYIEGIK